MSYSIIYDTLFVKTSDNGFLPFILSGSNNCYDAYNIRKRSRSWDYMYCGVEGFVVRPQDFLADMERCLTSFVGMYKSEQLSEGRVSSVEEIDDKEAREICEKKFEAYLSTQVYGLPRYNFKQYTNYFLNKFKKAVTIEELAKHDIKLFCITGRNDIDFLQKKGLKVLPDFEINNEDDLLRAITAHKLVYGDTRHLYLAIDDEYKIERYKDVLRGERRKKRFSLRIETKEVQQYYVLAETDNPTVYLCRKIKVGYSRSRSLGIAKSFITEKQAAGFLKKHRLQNSLTVLKIDKPQSFSKRVRPKNKPVRTTTKSDAGMGSLFDEKQYCLVQHEEVYP